MRLRTPHAVAPDRKMSLRSSLASFADRLMIFCPESVSRWRLASNHEVVGWYILSRNGLLTPFLTSMTIVRKAVNRNVTTRLRSFSTPFERRVVVTVVQRSVCYHPSLTVSYSGGRSYSGRTDPILGLLSAIPISASTVVLELFLGSSVG